MNITVTKPILAGGQGVVLAVPYLCEGRLRCQDLPRFVRNCFPFVSECGIPSMLACQLTVKDNSQQSNLLLAGPGYAGAGAKLIVATGHTLTLTQRVYHHSVDNALFVGPGGCHVFLWSSKSIEGLFFDTYRMLHPVP